VANSTTEHLIRFIRL
jgi:hypothetical protein